MKLVKLCQNDTRLVFEVLGNINSAHQGREFIVVNLDATDPIEHLKQELVADYLCFTSEARECVDWRELDNEITRIKSAKYHLI